MRIVPMAIGFGAQVWGFDPRAAWSDNDRAALRQAYDRHHLLVFADIGPIEPQIQVRIAALFGPVGANRNAQGEPWTELRNSEPTGSLPLPFHSDISFMPHPLEGLSLHAVSLPGVPSSTTFVSNARAWDRLSPALRDELGDLTADHVYEAPAEMALDWPRLAYPHRVRMTHRRTGRPFLFVSENHVTRINGLSEQRSAEVLAHLFATLYAADARYEHVWTEGELLVWDNLAIQHARTRPAPPCEGERVLQRVAIGSHNFPDQLAAERQRLAQ